MAAAAPKIVRDMSRWAYRATGLTPQVVLREADGVPEWEVSVEYDRTRASACYRQERKTGAWRPHVGHMIIDGQEYATASSAHALAVALLSPDEYIGGEVEESLEVEDRPVEEAPSLIRAVHRSVSSRLTAEQTGLPGFSLRVGTTSAGWAVLISFEQEVIEFRFRKTGSGWRLGTPAWRALRRGQDVTAHVDAALRAALNSMVSEHTQPLSEPARMLRKASPGARSNATAVARIAVNRV